MSSQEAFYIYILPWVERPATKRAGQHLSSMFAGVPFQVAFGWEFSTTVIAVICWTCSTWLWLWWINATANFLEKQGCYSWNTKTCIVLKACVLRAEVLCCFHVFMWSTSITVRAATPSNLEIKNKHLCITVLSHLVSGRCGCHFKNIVLIFFTHCGLVTPYGHIDLGQLWPK